MAGSLSMWKSHFENMAKGNVAKVRRNGVTTYFVNQKGSGPGGGGSGPLANMQSENVDPATGQVITPAKAAVEQVQENFEKGLKRAATKTALHDSSPPVKKARKSSRSQSSKRRPRKKKTTCKSKRKPKCKPKRKPKCNSKRKPKCRVRKAKKTKKKSKSKPKPKPKRKTKSKAKPKSKSRKRSTQTQKKRRVVNPNTRDIFSTS